MDEQVKHIAIGRVGYDEPTGFFETRMDLIDPVDCGVGFICGGKNNFSCVVDRTEQSAQRVSGQSARVVQPINRFVQRELGCGACKDEENGVGGAPYASYNRGLTDVKI
jgi:hypothetical protein